MNSYVLCMHCAAYVDVKWNPHCLSLLMAGHVVPVDPDPVLLKLSLSGPNLEVFLPADGVLAEVVLVPKMLCSKNQTGFGARCSHTWAAGNAEE